jgi:predicted nucleotidyltransferase component of viral defense system
MTMDDILSPLQRAFLQAFFAVPVGQRFFLTGGTALAAFYLHHRLSDDLDLFTLENEALGATIHPVEAIADDLGCALRRTRVSQYFQQLFLSHPQIKEPLKIDMVRDFGPQYGERLVRDGIIVDALDNIAANKVCALFGRADIKDFVDLYFILQEGYELEELFEMAREKDLGLTKFYFVGMLRQIGRHTYLPKMLKPLELEALQTFYSEMAYGLMSDLDPEQRNW